LKTLGVTTFVFGLPSSGNQAGYAAILQAFANAGAGQAVAPAVAAGQTQRDIYDQCFNGGDANAAGWKVEYGAAGKVDDPLTAAVDEAKTPLASYAVAGGTAKVYKPDPTDQDALAEEFRGVLSGVKSCTFDLGGDIKIITELLSEANVYVEDVDVPLDPMNGWGMSSPTVLELYGSACENWRQLGVNKIKWDFPCKIIVPK